MKKVRKPAALLSAIVLLAATMLTSAADAVNAAAVAGVADTANEHAGVTAAETSGTELSAAAEDECADFGFLWDYDNLAAADSLDQRGFTDDKTAWQLTVFERSAYAV